MELPGGLGLRAAPPACGRPERVAGGGGGGWPGGWGERLTISSAHLVTQNCWALQALGRGSWCAGRHRERHLRELYPEFALGVTQVSVALQVPARAAPEPLLPGGSQPVLLGGGAVQTRHLEGSRLRLNGECPGTLRTVLRNSSLHPLRGRSGVTRA